MRTKVGSHSRVSLTADLSRKVPGLRHHTDRPRRGRVARLTAAAAVLSTLVLGGCSSLANGFEPKAPGNGQNTSDTGQIIQMWVGTWIAALLVGATVVGLMIYAIVRFRRRSEDAPLPPQVRYNVPIEVLFTVVPLLMVGVLFYYTARVENALIDTSKKPDVTIQVVAKRWSWDFNYLDSNVYTTGTQTDLLSNQVETSQPILYLPVDKTVLFLINSRDVDHSFWVPAFLEKMDAIPGKTNKLEITPTQIGEFQGKCAELCGAYHSQMLFKVKVVSEADYQAEMAKLAAQGQSGILSITDSPSQLEPGQLVPTATGSNS